MGKQAVVIRLEVTRFPHYPLKRWLDARLLPSQLTNCIPREDREFLTPLLLLPPSLRAINVAELIHKRVSTILDSAHRKSPLCGNPPNTPNGRLVPTTMIHCSTGTGPEDQADDIQLISHNLFVKQMRCQGFTNSQITPPLVSDPGSFTMKLMR